MSRPPVGLVLQSLRPPPDEGKGTKRKQPQKKDQQAKKLKPGYSLLLLGMILECVHGVDCGADCGKLIAEYVGEHCLPVYGSKSRVKWKELQRIKSGKLPSRVLLEYSLHGFHFSSASPGRKRCTFFYAYGVPGCCEHGPDCGFGDSCEIGPGMLIPNATVICNTGTSREKGHYYLIVKVTPTQVKGILLRTVRVRTVHKQDLSRPLSYSFLYHLFTYDPAYDVQEGGFVKQIPGNRSYHYAGSMDTPLDERMTTKDERIWAA